MHKLTKSERISEGLNLLGITTARDVLFHLPRSYDNFTPSDETVLPIDKVRYVLVGRITSLPTYAKTPKTSIVTFFFTSNANFVYKIVAFNRPYLLKSLQVGATYTIVGNFDGVRQAINLVTIISGEMEASKLLRPIYSLPSAIANFEYIRLVDKAFKLVGDQLHSSLPARLQTRYKLPSLAKALHDVHFPVTFNDVYTGLRLLKYEECLRFALKAQLIRASNALLSRQTKKAIPLLRVNDFIKTMPFKLTHDQVSAIREIGYDLNKKTLMYRLLQGDVGTGKTLVAQLSLYANYLRGDVGALMAPTDTLAKQHYETTKRLFKDTGLRIALLVGSQSPQEKRAVKTALKAGLIDIIIGTHALFSKDVVYSSLGLVIIDEQHRFGVNQRAALLAKGDEADLLLMSATPIPRTLALTVYGDLDISTLRQFPGPSRSVETVINDDEKAIIAAINTAITNKQKVFIVAPRISADEHQLSAEQLFEKYRKKYPGMVSIVHGQMDSEERDDMLRRFIANERPLLVATSVIEVGIDVGDASLMIIYSPSHFGLASLHQLRGRIGRRGQLSKLILVANSDEAEQAKLSVLLESNDGFKIAEADLALRGPGQMEGIAQSGLPNFHYVNLINDFKMFEAASNDAKEIIFKSEDNDNRLLIESVKREMNTMVFTNV